MAQEQKQACPDDPKSRYALTVLKPRREVYAFWRDTKNMELLKHSESEVEKDGDSKRWLAKPKDSGHRKWDCQIVREVENELLEWKTSEQADKAVGGTLTFHDAPGGRGTEVRMTMWHDFTGGAVESAYLTMRKKHPYLLIREGMRRFKQMLETGETATIDGQPHG